MDLGRTGRQELIETVEKLKREHTEAIGKLCLEISNLNTQVTTVQKRSTEQQLEIQALKTPKKTIEQIAAEAAIWSQLTFGSDTIRGPIGPLKHLEKEAKEVQEKPDDLVEYADCLLLILDAARRAGFTLRQLLDATDDKLQVNKKRVWPKADETNVTEAIEHEKDDNSFDGLPLMFPQPNNFESKDSCGYPGRK